MIPAFIPFGNIFYLINLLVLCWIGHEIILETPSYFRSQLESVNEYIRTRTITELSDYNANTVTSKRDPAESHVFIPPSFEWSLAESNKTLWSDLVALNASDKLDGRVYSRSSIAYIDSINSFQNALPKGPGPLFEYRYFPMLYILARSVSDVQLVVRFAIKHRLSLGLESTGDHNGGNSLAPDGILLDLHSLQNITVDKASKTAYAETGLTFRQLQKQLQASGFHFPGPVAPLSGISQFLMCGAPGWGSSYYGTGADNVLSISLVDFKSGEFLTVNSTFHSDLFWAMRGGGNSGFAAAIGFTLQLYPAKKSLPTATLLVHVDPPKHKRYSLLPSWLSSSSKRTYASVTLERMLQVFNEFHLGAPPGLESTLVLVHTRRPKRRHIFRQKLSEKTRIAALWNVVGFSSLEASLPHWNSLNRIAHYIRKRTRRNDFVYTGVKEVNYKVATSTFVYNAPKRGLAVYGTQLYFNPPLNDAVIQLLVKHSISPPRLENSILIGKGAPSKIEALKSLKPSLFSSLLLGKQAAQNLPNTNNSVACRDCIFVGIYASWKRTNRGAVFDGDAAHIHWVRSVVRSLERYTVAVDEETILTQYKDPLSVGRPLHLQSKNLEKLQAIKHQCDPHNLTSWLDA